MYMHERMLDLSPVKPRSLAHRLVAREVIIGNPDITSVDAMQQMIEKINTVPDDKIETITFTELLS